MNKRYYIFAILFLGSLLLNGCATIYKNPKFSSTRKNHESLAILPFNVSFGMKKLPKDMTIEILKEIEKDESYLIQSEVYSYFLQRLSKNKYTIDFQDIDTTNSLLSRAGITFESIRGYTKADIARTLNVDIILSGTVHHSRPMSTRTAIVTAVLIRYYGMINRVDVDINIHNGADGTLLWKFNDSFRGGLGTSTQGMTKKLMKLISKKFPYTNK